MVNEHAQQFIKEVRQKNKELEASFKDVQDNFRQECGKAQRTVHVLFYRVTAACDDFYGSIHEGFQCMHDVVTSTDEDKAMALKNRCVMVNDWNTGVMSKRSRIEVQARGSPMQSYQAKLPGQPSYSRRSLVDCDVASFLDECDERSLPEQELLDVNPTDVDLLEDRDGDGDSIFENPSRSKYWHTKRLTRKTWPGQIENEVIIRKKTKKSNCFGGDGQQETLDQLIGIFRKNLETYNLTE
ncbi:hypothetical protein IV203_029858 [Nitzschia inconspicua]|uniref:Uncharacterized protein n=1 Tax=Nitzschia inconspicua TaxID=303405 RepID=A0A9K3LSH6_9STRA|nr:hypothetical protein IV203_029858 [Nitzschia inconspicua]